MRKSVSIVVGSEGQDGRILSAALKKEGRAVVAVNRTGPVNVLRAAAVDKLIKRKKPAEIYYLAAFNHSATDKTPGDAELLRRSHEVHVQGLVNCLEAMRRFSPKTRLFYAASSHVFGRPKSRIQNEKTPLNPVTIYGITKAAGLQACRYYRQRHGLFTCSGILYNHAQGPRFASRKIAKGAADVAAGRAQRLVLGNLDAVIDWGWAPDYVDAMRKIARHRVPDDFIVASGKARTVKEFVRLAFKKTGLDWRKHVSVKAGLITREKMRLVGDPRKLMRATGWKPRVGFERMIDLMLKEERAK